MLQGIWILGLRIFSREPSLEVMPLIPTFLAAAFMLYDFGIRKVNHQKVSKFLLFFTFLKAFLWTLAFVFVCLILAGVFTNLQAPSYWDIAMVSMVAVNMVVEWLTGIFALKVFRLTNQYFDLVNKKMSRGVTEDDLKYNC